MDAENEKRNERRAWGIEKRGEGSICAFAYRSMKTGAFRGDALRRYVVCGYEGEEVMETSEEVTRGVVALLRRKSHPTHHQREGGVTRGTVLQEVINL